MLTPDQYFRFGTRVISATGAQADWIHSNVLRLRINSSSFDFIVQALLCLCPPPLRHWLQSTFPEWYLPPNIVLKKEKEGWEEEFNTELATYDKLRCLQGHVIPVCYGQIEYDGARALILSDVGGECLADPEGATLEENELRPLLDQALSALAELRISHSDLKLDNFRLVNGTIMAVDLERVDEHASKEEAQELEPFDLKFLMKRYRDHLECLEEDGLLIR